MSVIFRCFTGFIGLETILILHHWLAFKELQSSGKFHEGNGYVKCSKTRNFLNNILKIPSGFLIRKFQMKISILITRNPRSKTFRCIVYTLNHFHLFFFCKGTQYKFHRVSLSANEVLEINLLLLNMQEEYYPWQSIMKKVEKKKSRKREEKKLFQFTIIIASIKIRMLIDSLFITSFFHLQ